MSPTQADALTRIDATLNGLCACGCDQPVPADSPSAWFAGQDCQQRWHEARTDRPSEVLDLPERSRWHGPPPFPGILHRAMVRPDRELFPWWCPDCSQHTDVPASGRAPVACPRCHLHGGPAAPAITWTTHHDLQRDHWTLRVHGYRAHAVRIVTGEELHRARDAAMLLRIVWTQMQVDLWDNARQAAGVVRPAQRPRRVPHQWMTDWERKRLCDWLEQHHVNPNHVPVDSDIDFDPAVGEWRIEVFRLRDGKPYIDARDDRPTIVVRRVRRAPLPWPEEAPAELLDRLRHLG